MNDPLGYDGARVVVTGTSSGIGAATARLLVDLGADVTALDIDDTTEPVTRSLHVDLRTNPGSTETPMMSHFRAVMPDPPTGPIGRLSTPEEQAWPLIVLNSPRLSYVTGEALNVEGGLFAALTTGQLAL